jgi:hypothetical protein
MKEEELAFLKAHIVELPATALRHLRTEILQERRKKSTGEQPVTSGRQLSYAEANKPSGTLKPIAKGTGTAAVPAAPKAASPRRTSAGPSGSVPGPLSGKPEDTTVTAAQVEGRVPPESDATKPRYTYRE